MKNIMTATMKMFSVLLVGGGFLLGGLVGEAFAVDGKIYSGSDCRPINTSRTVSNDPVPPPAHRYYGGRILNYSSSILTVVCPVVRDDTQNTDGIWLWTIIAKNNRYSTLTCRMSSRDALTGKELDGGTVQVPYNNHLKYGGEYGNGNFGPKISKSKYRSFYEMFCWIPPYSRSTGASYIQSYKVTE